MNRELSHNQKLVLDHYGLDAIDLPSLGHLDFDAMAENIRKPTKTAVCNILGKKGEIITFGGDPIKVGVEVEVKKAKEELKKKSMRFVKWF